MKKMTEDEFVDAYHSRMVSALFAGLAGNTPYAVSRLCCWESPLIRAEATSYVDLLLRDCFRDAGGVEEFAEHLCVVRLDEFEAFLECAYGSEANGKSAH